MSAAAVSLPAPVFKTSARIRRQLLFQGMPFGADAFRFYRFFDQLLILFNLNFQLPCGDTQGTLGKDYMLFYKIACCHIYLPAPVTVFPNQPLDAFVRRLFFLSEDYLNLPWTKERPSPGTRYASNTAITRRPVNA